MFPLFLKGAKKGGGERLEKEQWTQLYFFFSIIKKKESFVKTVSLI